MYLTKLFLFFAGTLFIFLQQGRTSLATCGDILWEQQGIVFSDSRDQFFLDSKTRCCLGEDDARDVPIAEHKKGEPLMMLNSREKQSSQEYRGATIDETTAQKRRREEDEPHALDRTTRQESSSEVVVQDQDLESLKKRALQFRSTAIQTAAAARVAEVQARSINAVEVGPFWDEAISRSREAAIAWDEMLRVYSQALSALPANCYDLQAKWRSEMENIKNAKNQSYIRAIWYMANKAESLATVAEDKALTAFAVEAVPLWDETIVRSRQASAAWDKVLRFCSQGIRAVPENRDDLKTEWRNLVESAVNANKITSVLAIWYAANKADNMAIVAAEKARKACAVEAGPLWDEAVARSREAVAVWDEMLRVYAQELATLPDNRDNRKAWWRTQIKNAENIKNKNSALIICYTAHKIDNVAIMAKEKAQRAPASEAVLLWDEAATRRVEAVAAYDEALKALNRGLGAVSINRDDLKIWWRYWIEDVEYLKNVNSTLAIWCMADKADKVAILAEEKASKAGGEEAGSLLDEALAKRVEAIATWYQVLEALKKGLEAVPEHRDELKNWWRSEIEYVARLCS